MTMLKELVIGAMLPQSENGEFSRQQLIAKACPIDLPGGPYSQIVGLSMSFWV